MLHYRLLVEVNDLRREVEKKATEQLHSWLRGKRLNADALKVGAEVALAPYATGALAISERPDGSRSLRAVIRENNFHGQWSTQLTVDVPGNIRVKPWLWLDMEGPDNITGEIPQLARSLLDVFDASTQDVRQGEAQAVHTTYEVRTLVEAVCDPRRRSLVVVAGSDPNLPFSQWVGHVRDLLCECVGLAGGYILSPETTEEFNNAIGPAHHVAPWTVRTFQPGVEPDDPDDARRHQVLGMDRIVADPVRRLARMLGRRAREAALETPLPTSAAKVDRAFAQITNANLLAPLDKNPVTPRKRADVVVETRPAERDVTATPAKPLPDPVLQALELVLDGRDITVGRVLELGELAELARNVQASRDAIGARFEAYETEVAALRGERQELRQRLEETQFDAAIAQEEHAIAAAEVRRLQKLLISSSHAAQIWVPDPDRADQRPQDCIQLAERLPEWPRVTFTGDPEKLRELDQYDGTGGWAGKIWDVLGTLDDYARAVLEGTFEGNVHNYLTGTPAGCRTFSATRHATDESATVRSSPKLKAIRMFPVPTTVSATEKIFMGAHFKIAQFGTISPRLYYHNNVRATGRIYVGYIGKHLKNSQTN